MITLATSIIDFPQFLRFIFLSFFLPFFFPPFLLHFACIGPSWRQNEEGTKRIGTDFCSCPFPWYCDCTISDELVKLAQSAVRLHVAVHPVPPLLPPSRSPSLQPLVFSIGWPVNRKRYKPRPRFWESSTPLALYSNHDNRNTDPEYGDLHQFWKISLIPRIACFHLPPPWLWKRFAILQNYNVSCSRENFGTWGIS